MYNFIKRFKIVPILLLVCVLAACSGGVKMHTVDKSYSTDTIECRAEIPQISGLSSESVQEAVNEEYEKTITGLMHNFSEVAKKTGDRSKFETATTVFYNKNGLFSGVTQVDWSAGSAHKNSFRITKNIDTKKCIEVEFSDLFEGDAYIDMINSRLEKVLEAERDKYSDLWEKPTVLENQKYYFDGKNLVLFYPPYELSYYERGFVEIPLPLSDMSGYLKPEYRKLAD